MGSPIVSLGLIWSSIEFQVQDQALTLLCWINSLVIISSDQKGCTKGRYIGQNTKLVNDIMNYLRRGDQSGMLLLLDFEKTFDTLHWEYIYKTLNVYNFGPSFINWVKIVCKTPRVVLQTLDKFYYCSGLKANLHKTQAVWLGKRPKKTNRGLKFDLTWVEEFRLLGINCTKEMSNMVERNYNLKIQSML